MEITTHGNSKGVTTAIYAESKDLGLKMVLRSSGARFEQIHVYERGVFGLFREKFSFKAGKTENKHSVKDGFWIDLVDVQGGEYPCTLRRRFFDLKDQTHKSGRILRMEFNKNRFYKNDVSDVQLFDLVDGVLVPVVSIKANGTITEVCENAVLIHEAPAPGARIVPKIAIGHDAW